MKTFKATTKSGRSYNVRLVEIKAHDSYKKLGVEGSHDKLVEIEVDGEWIPCWATEAGSQDKQHFAIRINALNKKAQDALSIPEKMRDKDCFISCDPWHDLYEEMVVDAEKMFSEKANSMPFSKITFMYNSSFKWLGFNTDNDALKDYLSYNEIISNFHEALKSIHPALLANYIVKIDRDDYSITEYYEVTVEDAKKIIDMSLPGLEKAREKKEEMERRLIAEEKKKTNIESGAIYFTCESEPHDKDLSDVILSSPADYLGVFTLDHRVDRALFNRIKNYGRYWNREFLEDCDMFEDEPGWRFNIDALKELAKDKEVYVNEQKIIS